MAKKVTDEELIVGLMSSQTQKECAEKLGLTQATITNRLKDPLLQEKLTEHRKRILDATTTQLINHTNKAVDVLVNLLDSNSEITRYNAASKILQLSQDYLTTHDIVVRLDKIELEQAEESQI